MNQENNLSLDIEIAEKVFGHTVSWWSIHPWDSDKWPEGELGIDWRLGISSAWAWHEGAEPRNVELLLPNDRGDMPGVEVLDIEKGWDSVSKYSDNLHDSMSVLYELAENKNITTEITIGPEAFLAVYMYDDYRNITVEGTYLPETICLAALQFLGVR